MYRSIVYFIIFIASFFIYIGLSSAWNNFTFDGGNSFLVDSTGNVGFGTMSRAVVRLQVAGY